MVTILELKGWVDEVAKNLPDSLAGVDDGGLTVAAVSPDGKFAWYEIGGLPEEDDAELKKEVVSHDYEEADS